MSSLKYLAGNRRSLLILIPLSVAAAGVTWGAYSYYRRSSTTRTMGESISQPFSLKHPKFWFEDGSLIIRTPSNIFRVHKTLLDRHSNYFSASIKEGQRTDNAEAAYVLDIPPELGLNNEDLVALLEHLYHDTPLSSESPFPHVASILRASSPRQLDFPSIHKSARCCVEVMFPSGPEPFTHPNHLEEALALATDYDLHSIKKGLYYSIVTTSDFEPDDSQVEDAETTPTESAGLSSPKRFAFSRDDIERCRNLMSSIVEDFTPLLFTVATTGHMACTDILAEKWMPLVIQHALASDGVYKPIESLQYIIDIDWVSHGLCEPCVIEKREEWKREQRVIWDKMDAWLLLPEEASTE